MPLCLYCGKEAGAAGYHTTCVPTPGTRRAPEVLFVAPPAERAAKAPMRPAVKKAWTVFVLLTVIVFAFSRACGESSDPAVRAMQEGERQRSEEASRDYRMISDVREAVRARMKDPESVQFRNLGVYAGGGVKKVCGEVNAKNSFGGYIGFQSFIGGGNIVVLPSDMTARDFRAAWTKFCQ